MTKIVRISVLGPTGRLGGAICREIIDSEGVELAGALVRASSDAVGKDIGILAGRDPVGVTSVSSLSEAVESADIVIDASLPDATVEAAEYLAGKGGPPLVTGVTGFSEAQDERLNAAAQRLPLLWAGNFSLGVAMAETLVRQAAALPADVWDIEIEEAHHRMKADAPSGTALMLARAAAEKRGQSLGDVAVWAREGHTGPREGGSIGFAVTRGGSIIGDHSVRFISEMEEITISHRAFDRAVFARGALAAAIWMHNNGQGRPAGMHSMHDVVGATSS